MKYSKYFIKIAPRCDAKTLAICSCRFIQSFPYTVTSAEYSDLTGDCVILGLPSGFGCNADMDEDLVYEITKIFNESTDEMTAAHSEGAEWNTDNSLAFYNNERIPFHPGDARYYDEIQGGQVTYRVR